MVHDAAFDRLKLVVVVDFDGIMHYESEEDIQTNLEGAMADLREAGVISHKSLLCGFVDLIRAALHIIITITIFNQRLKVIVWGA